MVCNNAPTNAASRRMSRPNSPRKYTVRIGNVFFLSRIGLSLRWAAQNIDGHDIPADVRQLLARLEKVEAEEQAAQRQSPDNAAG
jgi:hypothetical protein